MKKEKQKGVKRGGCTVEFVFLRDYQLNVYTSADKLLCILLRTETAARIPSSLNFKSLFCSQRFCTGTHATLPYLLILPVHVNSPRNTYSFLCTTISGPEALFIPICTSGSLWKSVKFARTTRDAVSWMANLHPLPPTFLW